MFLKKMTISPTAVLLLAFITVFVFIHSPVDAALTFWVTSADDHAYYAEMADKYRQDVDPDFEARFIAYGYRELADKLAIAMRTGQNLPDLMQLEETFFSLYIEDEIPFLDLTQRMAEIGLDQAIPEQRLDLFAYDGRLYGVPQTLGATLLFYRADLFETLGISPEDLATWDDFVAIGQEIATPDRALLAMDPSYFDILLRQRGQDWFDADGNFTVPNPLSIDTLQFLTGMIQDGVAREPIRGTIFDPLFLTSDLSDDRVLSVIGADWFALDLLKGLAPQMAGQWQAMPLPAWPDSPYRTSGYAGHGLVLLKNSPRIDEAWRFVTYVITEKDTAVERFLSDNSFPAYRPVWNDPRIERPDPYFGGQSLVPLLRELGEEMPKQYQWPQRSEVVLLMMDKYWNAVMNGSLSPEEALESLRDEVFPK